MDKVKNVKKNISEQPVKVGDVLENVKIEKLASAGDGLFRHEGLVVMVPNAKVGQVLNVKIKELRANCAFAEVY